MWLEGRSLAVFFYSVIGKTDEKLDRELSGAAGWAAMDHISCAQDQVSGTTAQIHRVLIRLQEMERGAAKEQALFQERLDDGLVLCENGGR